MGRELVAAGANWAQCPYKDWYFISEGNSTYDDAFAYRSWEGHEELPELNVESEQVRARAAARGARGRVGRVMMAD
eukprot:1065982-Rhodomonas_salina.3